MYKKRGEFSADVWQLVSVFDGTIQLFLSSIFLSCFFFFSVHKGTHPQSEIHEANLLEDVIDRFPSIYL